MFDDYIFLTMCNYIKKYFKWNIILKWRVLWVTFNMYIDRLLILKLLYILKLLAFDHLKFSLEKCIIMKISKVSYIVLIKIILEEINTST